MQAVILLWIAVMASSILLLSQPVWASSAFPPQSLLVTVDTSSFALILLVKSLLTLTIKTVLSFSVTVKAITVFGFCCCRANSLIILPGTLLKVWLTKFIPFISVLFIFSTLISFL